MRAAGRPQPAPMSTARKTAARLREMARELLMEADALDAGVEMPKPRRRHVALIDPRKEVDYAKL